MLTQPKYTQPQVLQVTQLKPALLQTWINRNAIELSEQNPGYGHRRLYSAIDVVKLAIMRRLADLHLALGVAKEIAGAAAERLLEAKKVEWDDYIFLRPDAATHKLFNIEIIAASGMSKLAKYGWCTGDPAFMRLSDLVEPDRHVFPRRPRRNLLERIQSKGPDIEPVDPMQRELLARNGIHAEPVVVFPIGEIVNGALMQLNEIDSKRGTDDRTAAPVDHAG